MKILTKDEIFAADDLPREAVNVPEWGGSVYVRTMTGADRDSFEAKSIELKGDSQVTNLVNLRARLVAMTTVDESGKRLFSESDIARLGEKSSRALQRVFEVATKLNALSKNDVEELTGN